MSEMKVVKLRFWTQTFERCRVHSRVAQGGRSILPDRASVFASKPSMRLMSLQDNATPNGESGAMSWCVSELTRRSAFLALSTLRISTPVAASPQRSAVDSFSAEGVGFSGGGREKDRERWCLWGRTWDSRDSGQTQPPISYEKGFKIKPFWQ